MRGAWLTLLALAALAGCRLTSEPVPGRDSRPPAALGAPFVCSDDASQAAAAPLTCVPRSALPADAVVLEPSRPPLGGLIPKQQPSATGHLTGGLIVGPLTGDLPPALRIGTSRHGIVGRLGCQQQHYLLGTQFDGSAGYNPFQWWRETGAAEPPPTGPIHADFGCEFSPVLARVIGRATQPDETLPVESLGFEVAGWEASVDSPPFEEPGVGVSVRHLRPLSLPVLRSVNHEGRLVVALVNEIGPEGSLDPDENVPRPSLWLDFDSPRRAVGLEYGYLRDPDLGSIWRSGVTLLAYDEQGRFVVGADGMGCPVTAAAEPIVGLPCQPALEQGLRLGQLDARIGVRDRAGRIASVELRFDRARAGRGDDPGRRIVEPQVVSRIWHEALPPAAVLQGLVGREGTRQGATVLPPFAQRYSVLAGPRTFALPYRFDRAAVFLRGFRLEASGAPAQSLSRLEIGLEQNALQFEPGTGAPLTVTPVGSVGAAGGPLAFDVVAYFTVVGWDSRQVELGAALGRPEPLSWNERLIQVFGAPDPRTQVTRIFTPVAGERLFVGIQSLTLQLLGGQDELDRLTLWPGYQRGLGSALTDWFMLRPLSGGALWSLQSTLETDDDRAHFADARIVVLGGTSGSLALGADPIENPQDDPIRANASAAWAANLPVLTQLHGPRLPPHAKTHDAAIIRSHYHLAWPVRAQVPFLTMGYVYAAPRGQLGELDVEFKGEFYDGHVVDWTRGHGMSDDPRSSSPGSTPRAVLGVPTFGAVNQAAPRSGGTATVGALVLHDATIGCENRYPDRRGFVENTDRVPLMITGLRLEGSEESMFEHEFVWRGQRFDSDGLRARTPLQLRAGERLEIHPIYTPAGPAGVVGTALPPHTSRLVFESRSPWQPTFVVTTSGRTDGLRPEGRWSVSRVQLGLIAPGASRRQTVQLASTGDARLCVLRVHFPTQPPGFQVLSLSNAMTPEVLTIEVGCTNTGQPGVCQGQHDLVVESNAGLLTLPVSANVAEPPLVVPPCVTPEDYFRGCSG